MCAHAHCRARHRAVQDSEPRTRNMAPNIRRISDAAGCSWRKMEPMRIPMMTADDREGGMHQEGPGGRGRVEVECEVARAAAAAARHVPHRRRMQGT
jgi:hypothetical protein